MDRGWCVVDVLNNRLGELGVPVLGGLYAGHDLVDALGAGDQCAVPLGSMATLDASEGHLTVKSIVSE